jgi:hypothetical protein
MTRARPRTPVIAALLALGCASAPPPPPPPPDWSESLRAEAVELGDHLRALPVAPASELVVRLAFPREADLDVYVTDPQLETIYYANTPARSGGRLERDARCSDADAEPVRVEAVLFAAPLRGRYRVGVDHPERCGDGDEVVPYAISIDANGERSIHAGLARWLDFTTIATEFALP